MSCVYPGIMVTLVLLIDLLLPDFDAIDDAKGNMYIVRYFIVLHNLD